MIRVCQFCHRGISPDNNRNNYKWTKENRTASHGICKQCNAEMEIIGHDTWVDITAYLRKGGILNGLLFHLWRNLYRCSGRIRSSLGCLERN